MKQPLQWFGGLRKGGGDSMVLTMADCSLVMGSSLTMCQARAPISLRAIGAKGVDSDTWKMQWHSYCDASTGRCNRINRRA